MKVNLPDPKHPDMSPEGIDERLQMVEALRKLGVSLKEAGELGPIGNAKEAQRERTDEAVHES